MLTVSGLDFSYGSKVIFDGLNLDVAAGEHIVIVGDSGGGKSTLLNLIAEGGQETIQLKQQATSTMVLQESGLLDHLNVIENLKLVARFSNSKGLVDESKVSAALEQLNIDVSLHKADISQLSGGQLRRVAIARALLTNPDVVLFDEPDAGLDITNLSNLTSTVNELSLKQGKACITVSHNPFYIAQIANKVYRLQGAKLVQIADWKILPVTKDELQNRQLMLQSQLSVVIDTIEDKAQHHGPTKPQRDWVIAQWLVGALKAVVSLPHFPKSPKDEFRIAAYGTYLSFVSGILFFALVGLMLGATTISVVRTVADSALTGIVSMFIKPETLINLMGGRYVLYLAPAIGGMLFAARSGSIMSNWLGEMVRGKQVRALDLLGVSSVQYLATPSVIAVFISMFATISWFTFSVWLGGVVAASQLFEIEDASDVMRVSLFDLQYSLFWGKTLIYSAVVALTVVGLGLAPKKTAHQVNIHTTKTIIYSTLCIAFIELILILR